MKMDTSSETYSNYMLPRIMLQRLHGKIKKQKRSTELSSQSLNGIKITNNKQNLNLELIHMDIASCCHQNCITVFVFFYT